ncbi:hypothetical protein [Devosia submarina]|uniref:hypothetical protein n=1 Tax=Devosia submarina TaxID=1173082 RepID=UPI000D334F8B|nr:hypothetical protein [Devosia submarina]
MSFRDGLLQARGQIVFIAALVCSTAAIVYLESLDTTERLRAQVVASVMATGSASPSLTPQLRPVIEAAVEDSSRAFEADPATLATQATALDAAVLGLIHGIGTRARHEEIVERILDQLEATDTENALAIAPSLGLAAAAMPDLQSRISALLVRQ